MVKRNRTKLPLSNNSKLFSYDAKTSLDVFFRLSLHTPSSFWIYIRTLDPQPSTLNPTPPTLTLSLALTVPSLSPYRSATSPTRRRCGIRYRSASLAGSSPSSTRPSWSTRQPWRWSMVSRRRWSVVDCRRRSSLRYVSTLKDVGKTKLKF